MKTANWNEAFLIWIWGWPYPATVVLSLSCREVSLPSHPMLQGVVFLRTDVIFHKNVANDNLTMSVWISMNELLVWKTKMIDLCKGQFEMKLKRYDLAVTLSDQGDLNKDTDTVRPRLSEQPATH